jgi:hypothetical protein
LDFETIYTMTDYHDGPVAGVADFRGAPHRYQAEWIEGEQEFGDWYTLTPIDEQTLGLALEEWRIWLRWRVAFDRGSTSQATHPALPEDRPRWEALQPLLSNGFAALQDRAFKAKAEFRVHDPKGVAGDCAHIQVRWHAV